MFCKRCGYSLRENEKFCERCGEPAYIQRRETVNQPIQSKEFSENIETEKNNKFLVGVIVVLIVTLLVCISVMGFIAASNYTGSNKDENNQVPEVAVIEKTETPDTNTEKIEIKPSTQNEQIETPIEMEPYIEVNLSSKSRH